MAGGKPLKNIELEFYVKPRSKETKLVLEGNTLVFYTTEPPVKGKANASLIKYIARKLGISSSKISITRGLQSQLKLVKIQTEEQDKNKLVKKLVEKL